MREVVNECVLALMFQNIKHVILFPEFFGECVNDWEGFMHKNQTDGNEANLALKPYTLYYTHNFYCNLLSSFSFL